MRYRLSSSARAWRFTLLPLGLTIFAYGSGIVLLLGGVRVWRAALFPLALLLFVNPVPKVFQLVDLPLQFFCARVAQSFALAIGVHPDVNQLRLMFAPGFGMFIAPGCDGIRGAVTMGYLALILGYLYRFSIRARFLSAIGAVALGYLFNLIRLCFLSLVLSGSFEHSIAAVAWKRSGLFDRRVLFLTAAALFSGVVRWKRQNGGQPASSQWRETASCAESSPKNHQLYWKGAIASLLVAVSSFSSARDLAGYGTRQNAGRWLGIGIAKHFTATDG